MVKINHYLLCFLLIFSVNSFIRAGNNADSTALRNLQAMAAKIKQPTVQKGDETISLPKVPTGYHLQLAGTDCTPVIAADGQITLPLTTTLVHLYYTLSDAHGHVADVPSVAVMVPGRYESANTPKPFVVPEIREWVGHEGQFTVTKGMAVVVDPAHKAQLESVAQTFAADYKALTGNVLAIKFGKPKKGDLFFTLDNPEKSLGEEGYLMEIGEHIAVRSNHAQGCFWATRTILQLLEQSNAIPCGLVRDYPKYQRRGFMLDVGRKFFSMAFLRDYVKFMSHYKMNEFHIHLNDNAFKQFYNHNWDSTYSAFRLESTTFPGLAAKDGHYTKKEFIELQQLAAQYGVNIVPEIDAPAHTLAFYHYDAELGSAQYGKDHLDLHNPKTYEFLDALFKEYLEGENPVFIGKEVHIGTDEYDKREAEKFRYFTDRYIRYIESFGKRARLWGALTHAQGTTPVKSENVIMDAWYNGYADPAEMIKQGYDLVSIPDGLLYIVPAAGYYYDYLNNQYLYENWEPVQIGKAVFPYGHPNILGGKFAVWNDHAGNGITEKDVHHRVLPSMKVLSQKMWQGNHSAMTYADFKELSSRLMEAPGVNVAGLVDSKDSLVLSFNFEGKKLNDQSGNGYHFALSKKVKRTASPTGQALVIPAETALTLPVKEIGYDYTVEMMVKRETPANGTVLWESANATVWLSDPKSGKLGFSRDGYTYTFNYTLPAGKWVKIAIQGDHKGTALYVDGQLVERLQGRISEFNGGKDKRANIQTLVFPLQQLGSEINNEPLLIDNLNVFNKMIGQ